MVSSSVTSQMKIGLTVKQERTWEKHSWGYARPWVIVLNSAICMPVAPPHEGVLDFVCMERLRHLCLCSGTLLLLIICFYCSKRQASQEVSSRLKKRNLSLKLFTKSVLLDELNGRSHKASSWGCWSVQSRKPLGLCCTCGSCLQWMA